MLSPEIAKRLLASADGQELALFLRGLINSLDTIADIPFDDPVEALVEMKARKRAVEKLGAALSTLLTDEPRGTLPDVRDSFDVDV